MSVEPEKKTKAAPKNAAMLSMLGAIAARSMPGNAPAPAAEQPAPAIEPQPQPATVLLTHPKVAQQPYKARKKRLEAPNRPLSRQNKRAATVWLDPAAKRQLDYQCVTEDLNCEEALRDALNDWFDKRKLSRIA